MYLKFNELTFKYIEKIPGDSYSGAPLLFRRQKKGYLLYSLGANGVEDCGEPCEESESSLEHGEISIRMPMTPKKQPPVAVTSASFYGQVVGSSRR